MNHCRRERLGSCCKTDYLWIQREKHYWCLCCSLMIFTKLLSLHVRNTRRPHLRCTRLSPSVEPSPRESRHTSAKLHMIRLLGCRWTSTHRRSLKRPGRKPTDSVWDYIQSFNQNTVITRARLVCGRADYSLFDTYTSFQAPSNSDHSRNNFPARLTSLKRIAEVETFCHKVRDGLLMWWQRITCIIQVYRASAAKRPWFKNTS